MLDQTIKNFISKDYFSLSASLSVGEAINCIRQYDDSSLHEYYLVNENQVLCGRVTLHCLLMAQPDQGIQTLALKNCYTLNAEDDQEEAARLFRQHSLFSLPIINDQLQLVGIVTYADGMHILLEEDQEDIERMMGISGEGNAVAYRDLTISQHIKNRVGWLVALALLGFISGSILMHYESALD